MGVTIGSGALKGDENSVVQTGDNKNYFRYKTSAAGEVSTRTIVDTKPLADKPREKLLEQISKKKIEVEKVRKVVKAVREFSKILHIKFYLLVHVSLYIPNPSQG